MMAGMTEELSTQRVEVRFAGVPHVQQIERAPGVSEIEIDGSILRCLVSGSFQPFLESLRGYEVISLRSTPAQAGAEPGTPDEKPGEPR